MTTNVGRVCRHLLPVLLPPVCTLVAEVHDSGSERACFDEPEAERRVRLRPEGDAASKHHRMNNRPVFVDQTEAHEACGEVRTAEAQVVARLCCQPRDLVGDNIAPQRRIPCDLFERLRENDLGLVSPDTGILDLDG